MSWRDAALADVALLLAQDGETVTYQPDGGDAVELMGMPLADGTVVRGSDGGRTSEYRALVAVSKMDVASVAVNKATLTVPGDWVGSTEQHVALRVAALLGDRSDPGVWMLACR